jgi:oleate hydratase
MITNREQTKAYLVGSRIASLAPAAFLIRDGGFRGDKIYVFEGSDLVGGV